MPKIVKPSESEVEEILRGSTDTLEDADLDLPVLAQPTDVLEKVLSGECTTLILEEDYFRTVDEDPPLPNSKIILTDDDGIEEVVEVVDVSVALLQVAVEGAKLGCSLEEFRALRDDIENAVEDLVSTSSRWEDNPLVLRIDIRTLNAVKVSTKQVEPPPEVAARRDQRGQIAKARFCETRGELLTWLNSMRIEDGTWRLPSDLAFALRAKLARMGYETAEEWTGTLEEALRYAEVVIECDYDHIHLTDGSKVAYNDQTKLWE